MSAAATKSSPATTKPGTAASSSEDSVTPLQPSPALSSSPPIRGHRPSVLGSVDLSDESRDTVDATESDTWYPQFSPAATLPQAKKLEAQKQSGLNALLQNRMAKSTFESRFLGGADLVTTSHSLRSLPPTQVEQAQQALEATNESLFNRSAKLGALLANRPDKSRLESMNIIKAGVASASSSATPSDDEHTKKMNRLNTFLTSRPSTETLIKRGVLDLSADPATASSSSAPSARARDERHALAKSALSELLAARPNPEQAIKQRIITDIGDLPGGLERRQENALVPTRVAALANFVITHVSLGFSHTLALDSKGTIHVCGSGANGRLGISEGAFGDVAKPTALPASHFGGETITAIDAGENHSAAITKSGKLYTWGTGAWGRLGLGNQDDQSVPKLVTFPANECVESVSCGAYHTLVLTSFGDKKKLYAFGWNKNGRCGVGRKHPSLLILTPIEVPFFSLSASSSSSSASAASASSSSSSASPNSVVSVSAHFNTSSARTANGTTYLWGSGTFGNLGFGEEADVWEPRELSVRVKEVSLGATHTLACLEKDHRIVSFGCNDKHQLGRTDDATHTNLFLPIVIPSLTKPVSLISAGKSHSLCMDQDGVKAFGIGARGVLGLGDEKDVKEPTLIPTLKGETVVQLDTSWTHSAAVTKEGKLFVWGAKLALGL